MMKQRFMGAACAVALVLLSHLGLATTAVASDVDSTAEALMELNPGVTKEQVIAQAEELADQLGRTPLDVLSQQLAESRESVAKSSRTDGIDSRSSGSGGDAWPIIGNATLKGDVFYSPASTLGITHGHTGIYYTIRIIVEAPGPGKLSRSISARSLQVAHGTVKQHVRTSQENRNAAANYAYNHMRNKPYNLAFFNNKQVPASSYNCSQLVWGAYKQGAGIDLDGNGGMGVYPADIRDSSWTRTYQTVE